MWLSIFQAEKLITAHKEGKLSVDITLDLGITESAVQIVGDKFVFPDKQTLTLADLKKIVKNPTVCFFVEDNQVKKIHWFSEEMRNFYKLVPTGMKSPPTFEISGIKMHVVKEFAPDVDTKRKIAAKAPIRGKVLDTCLGLGYTAMEAAKTADAVVSCERDENVLKLIEWNPSSKPLLENRKITIIHDDVEHRIKGFPDNEFDCIIHDPPRLTLSSALYSSPFYAELYRVLKRGGKLYHYTGRPGSKKRGLDLPGSVMIKLKRVGFRNVRRVHYGIAAEK
ncbi:methyltransferase domain-containing protein [Candidatus Woesearchaeota archaeon]|nr:methyltransferase domain-containing protein [Candidatus Woesearchaeota archaeon]